MRNRVVVIGGGFFGMYLAECMAKRGHDVLLVEERPSFMTRASYHNQARVHNGYHYPRSVLTALRSRVSFPRFVSEFSDCVNTEFDQYYLIAKRLSKVTGRQFQVFCDRIGAVCEPAPNNLSKMLRPNMVDASFRVKEFAFDSSKLSKVMSERVASAGCKVRLGTVAESVREGRKGLTIKMRDVASNGSEEVFADHVFNCTYSRINSINLESDIETIPLKHELTEMCLVQVPEELQSIGVTVMCGPFFSVMPFPSVGMHSFSHVRYTPHYEWHESALRPFDFKRHEIPMRLSSSWRYMVKDAARYIPILEECAYRRSLWEVKTVLPSSETDDSRPILFKANHGLQGFHCVMGGKIDNVYDAENIAVTLSL